jgi:hypothetical protein
MAKRRHLGSIYTIYPAKTVGSWLGDKLFKLIATVIISFVWAGMYYVLIGVVNFLKNNFMAGAQQTTTIELYRTEASLWVLAITTLGITIYVFRSKIGERRKQKDRR